MGWFWADIAPQDPEGSINPRRRNQIDEKLGGTFWAPQADIWAEDTKPSEPAESISRCPVDHTKLNWSKGGKLGAKEKVSTETPPPSSSPQSPQLPPTHPPVSTENSAAAAKCPVDHSAAAAAPACPVDHTKYSKLNNMPHLATSKLPGQQIDLPTERTVSSIPRGEGANEGFWEYPSPQQMLNAMVRKSGRDGIPEDAVESMVDVHNFLNEGVWEEVLQWEKPYTEESSIKPRLLKFQGRPGDMSPRARMLQALGWVYPSKFGVPAPFDRHDWTVLRAVPGHNGEWKKVRYVIDFYEIPDDDSDTPTFTVDVRPAADSLANIYDRAKVAWGPVISKAMGW